LRTLICSPRQSDRDGSQPRSPAQQLHDQSCNHSAEYADSGPFKYSSRRTRRRGRCIGPLCHGRSRSPKRRPTGRSCGHRVADPQLLDRAFQRVVGVLPIHAGRLHSHCRLVVIQQLRPPRRRGQTPSSEVFFVLERLAGLDHPSACGQTRSLIRLIISLLIKTRPGSDTHQMNLGFVPRQRSAVPRPRNQTCNELGASRGDSDTPGQASTSVSSTTGDSPGSCRLSQSHPHSRGLFYGRADPANSTIRREPR
jgi:hypothetical protein